jgi:hypothetical protein
LVVPSSITSHINGRKEVLPESPGRHVLTNARARHLAIATLPAQLADELGLVKPADKIAAR